MGGFMKHAVEMGSGAMIHIPSFIKIGSAIQKLIGGIQRQHGDLISLLLFFQNKESRPEIYRVYRMQMSTNDFYHFGNLL
jgi:hypothetical protein